MVVRRSDLISDKTRFSSCGCYAKKEKTKFMKEHNPNKSHGLTGTRLYKIYSKMHERCYRKNYHQFYLYGGRGIEICDEWLNHFKTFYDWAMSHGYDDNKSIDRINCNLNYSPENCRWADIYQQANNKRNNVVLTYKGNTMTLAEWARQLKLPYSTIADRYKKGKPITEILYPKKLRP
ncbi:hypothetical protein DY124_06200 [Apilactobacillus micheneri]|nr:hypothetical protein DYZ97_07320 [Apilactobacillus timberlakei]TPR43198.1 hypothetical protein DY124_06200 [Apilactobacillus micheneri]TPR47269.1 hypothetical protein DY125_06695 [Apilactobacillus micheneri]